MARHNREGTGTDQRGHRYAISYQPDWLRLVKVTRGLESGRQSTMTLFRNPAPGRQADPGERVRTRITSPEQDLDFEIAVTDRNRAVKRVRVAYTVSSPNPGSEEIVFTLENDMPPPNGGDT
ncbi:MAG: hypothetical protein HY704_04725 [Gemmatimonadetes bacterium]|nr:hypothetical protein [Gemmatimonadota bacterium]